MVDIEAESFSLWKTLRKGLAEGGWLLRLCRLLLDNLHLCIASTGGEVAERMGENVSLGSDLCNL